MEENEVRAWSQFEGQGEQEKTNKKEICDAETIRSKGAGGRYISPGKWRRTRNTEARYNSSGEWTRTIKKFNEITDTTKSDKSGVL